MNAQNIGAILDALATRFGATGAMLWQALLRQVYVNAVVSVLQTLVLLAVAGTMFYFAHRRAKGDAQFVLYLLGGVVSAFVVTSVVCTISDVGMALNPQYGALRLVLKALRLEGP